MVAKKKNKAKNKGNRGTFEGTQTSLNENRDGKRLTKTKSPSADTASSSAPSGIVTRSRKKDMDTPTSEESGIRLTSHAGQSQRDEVGVNKSNLPTVHANESTHHENTESHVNDTTISGKQISHSCSKQTTVMSGIQVTFYSSAKSHKGQGHNSNGLDGDKDTSYKLHHPQSKGKDNLNEDDLPIGASDVGTSINLPTNADIIEALNAMKQSLKGEMSDMTHKIDQLNSKMNKVENDLQSLENKWEGKMDAVIQKVSALDKNNKSLEKRWELHRSHQSKELSIIQTGIDSNSSAVLELTSTTKKYQEKWEHLESLEKKIEKAADKKFRALKDIIKTELGAELKAEVLEEARSTFAPNTSEIKVGLKMVEQRLLQQVQSNHTAVKEDIQHERLKGQAYAKQQNLLIFGLPEESSSHADTRAVLAFFAQRMNLPHITVYETFRLGQILNHHQNTPRPLVVRFQNIQDRWAVWNRKGAILKVDNLPIWIHEDLPKKLREENRVFNRIARTARQKPDTYRDVRVKDFQLSINGITYSQDGINMLPEELSPREVYTPRTDHVCVFFTRYSPLSNHHPSNFQIGDQYFVCVEQFLALRRAQLARDESLIQAALQKQDPADHKVILNTLRDDQPHTWREKAEEYILQATRAKFKQNEDLADFLIETHPLEIGEASRNTVWGIGMTLDSTDVFDISKWVPGGNLLGKTLVKVRDELIKTYTN